MQVFRVRYLNLFFPGLPVAELRVLPKGLLPPLNLSNGPEPRDGTGRFARRPS